MGATEFRSKQEHNAGRARGPSSVSAGTPLKASCV